MVFAIEMDVQTLWSFRTAEDAMSQCENYDVVDGGWKFFAEDGVELSPQFEPVPRFLGIKVYEPGYDLTESMRTDGPNLRSYLSTIRSVEIGVFSTIAEVEAHLNRHAAAKDQ
jgi:hypothetical protein